MKKIQDNPLFCFYLLHIINFHISKNKVNFCEQEAEKNSTLSQKSEKLT